MKLAPFLIDRKINLKWIVDLYVRAKTINNTINKVKRQPTKIHATTWRMGENIYKLHIS